MENIPHLENRELPSTRPHPRGRFSSTENRLLKEVVMISVSVNASGQYRYGLHLTEEREIGTVVQLGNRTETTLPKWLVLSHQYSRRRLRHERVYECDIETRDQFTLVDPYTPNEIALVRFNTSAGRRDARHGYTQKYWESPTKVERALTLEDTGYNWEDAVYVMHPGDTVFVHPGNAYLHPYVMRWTGDSLERFAIGTFNQYVIQPWLADAAQKDIRAALSNAKRRRHHRLTMILRDAIQVE